MKFKYPDNLNVKYKIVGKKQEWKRPILNEYDCIIGLLQCNIEHKLGS